MQNNYSIKETAELTGVSEKTLRKVIGCGALKEYAMVLDNYSIKEAAELTGVSDKTLRRVISCGALAAYKPGRAIRIRKKDLDKWFLSTRLRPAVLSDAAAEILTEKSR